jgi:hypothetical protein
MTVCRCWWRIIVVIIVSKSRWVFGRMPHWMLRKLSWFTQVLTLEVLLKVFARVCAMAIVSYSAILCISGLLLRKAWAISAECVVRIVPASRYLYEI